MGIVSRDDFGDLTKYSSLSPLNMLAIVAEKALEKEGFSQALSLDIPMVERRPIIVTRYFKSKPDKFPDLPLAFRDKISKLGGSEPNLVIQKELKKCDVDVGHSRITIPKSESRICLSEHEERLLEVRDEKGRVVGFGVQVIEPRMRVREVTFKKWSYTNTETYVLVKPWNEVVADNDLKIGDLLQIWSFRIQAQLGFALVKLHKESFDVQWGVKRRRTGY